MWILSGKPFTYVKANTKKDRIVPLAESMAVGLKKYLKAENPHVWLFNGKEPDGRYSVRDACRG